jgi:hypothetical protein
MPRRTCWVAELMNHKRIVAVIATLAVCGVLSYFYAGHRTPSGQPPLVELEPTNFTTIENAFNAAKDEVRVLVLLSPT